MYWSKSLDRFTPNRNPCGHWGEHAKLVTDRNLSSGVNWGSWSYEASILPSVLGHPATEVKAFNENCE